MRRLLTKERLNGRELESLNKTFTGIKSMNRLPDLLFIIDDEKKISAVARKLIVWAFSLSRWLIQTARPKALTQIFG